MDNVTLFPVYKHAAKLAVEQFNDGEMISTEWLMDNLEMTPPEYGSFQDIKKFQFAWLSAVENFKHELLTVHKIDLVTVRGKGYQVIPAQQQSSVAMTEMKSKMYKELTKTIHRLINIRDELLTANDVRYRDEALAKVAAISAFSTSQMLTKEKKLIVK